MQMSDIDKFLELCERFRDIMFDGLGKCSCETHQIETENGSPVYVPIRTMSKKHEELTQEFVRNTKKEGIIVESVSPYNAPLVFVKKQDGSTRVFVDFRKLNSVTTNQFEIIPMSKDIFNFIGATKPKFFSTIDLESGYWQIPMHFNSPKS